MKLTAWLRSTWRALTGSGKLETKMQAEMRFHIDMEAERLVREEHLAPDEARRQAHIRFGGVEKYKEQARDTRGLAWLDAMSLDAKLGVRMLVKHRWLTLVGGFAMAIAIAIGSTFFEMGNEVTNAKLPLPDGGRVVAVQFATDVEGSPDRRVLAEFATLKGQLQSIENFSAFHTVQLNLVTPSAQPEPIKAAAMSASGFVVAKTPPLLGRYLVPDDERPGAANVVVIGYTAWKTRFALDPQIVGHVVTLGDTPATIVGVMPEGFAFPIDHQFWIPLRDNPVLHKPLSDREVYLFGRLAAGSSVAMAQSELDTLEPQFKTANPEKHARTRLLVNPYTREFTGAVTPARLWFLAMMELLISALMMVVAVNIAILIYARTVARMGEIAVRTALGASRKRILSQLFMEAFALALVGAAAGLMLASTVLWQVQFMVTSNAGQPYWRTFKLHGGTVLYALAFAAVSAFVMGVIPGLKATGRRVNANLQQLSGRSGQKLGPMWTALVVAQIAVAVAALPAAVYLSWLAVRMEVVGAGFDTGKYMISVAAMGDDGSAVDADRWKTRQSEVLARMAAEPGVTGVTFSSAVPGFDQGPREIEFDNRPGHEVDEVGASSIYGGLNMLTLYGTELIAGRSFATQDLDSANSVIVNRTFAEKYFPGGTALGGRFRYRNIPAVHEIIGVVEDFPRFPPSITLDGEPVVYHAASTGTTKAVIFTTKFAGEVPAGTDERLRRLAASIDPAIQMRRVVPLSNYYRDLRSMWRNLAWGVGLMTTAVLLLSAAGIYALMSLTVAQRTREIGIRTALGAEPRRLIFGVLARSARQISVGLILGSILSAAAFSASGFRPAVAASLIGSVAILMVIVGLLSAMGPARRILRVQATDALKAEG